MLLQIRLLSAKSSIFVILSNCYYFFFLMHFSFPLYLHLFFISSCSNFDLSLLLYFPFFFFFPGRDYKCLIQPILWIQIFHCLLAVTAGLKTGTSSAGDGKQRNFGWSKVAQGIHSDKKGAFPRAGAAACPPSPLVLQPPYAALPPDKHLVSLESNIFWLLVSS